MRFLEWVVGGLELMTPVRLEVAIFSDFRGFGLLEGKSEIGKNL